MDRLKMIRRLAHVCLNVKNLERSIEYYARLGFTPQFRFTKNGKQFGAYLKIADGNYIEIFENPEIDKVQEGGIAHFCLETDDIDSLIRKLSVGGIEFTKKKLGCDNTYQIWLTDPDGNRFEVHQYTSGSSQRTGVDVEADW
ncbi:MAG: VOC family protein [Fibrobacter sp.]|nr:VOC family protein [Fibrobacter sp.]